MDKLVESSSFLNDDSMIPKYNLFFSKTNVYPMVKYEEQLKQINDYCYMTRQSFDNKIDELNITCSQLTDMQYEFEEFVIGAWKDLADDMSRCTLLILLISFLESSLHEIAKWFCNRKGIAFRERSKTNNIMHFLDLIGKCCNYNFVKVLNNEMGTLKVAIEVRNKFVHQPWDSQFNREKMFCISDIINTLAVIFQTVEDQAISSDILKLEKRDL